MPIKDNLNGNEVKMVFNTQALLNGDLDSAEFSYPLLKKGSDLGITFSFSLSGTPTGITTISILQATSSGGSFTVVPVESINAPGGVTIPAADTAFNADLLRVGLFGALGPFFKVRATNTAAAGNVTCQGIIRLEGSP